MQTVGAYEAKTNLADILNKVRDGESFTITRHGVPVAVLTRPTEDNHANIDETINAIRTQRKQFSFKGLNIKELIEEGRK